jgi:spore coat polysaccharide biosynthesis protein SpsF (cytidylyltransferase family)
MKKINCDVFIPIRLNSTRLPKKHLQIINGKPALLHLIERLNKCSSIRKIIVCTTTSSTDDELVRFLEQENILFYRGNEKDILQRFLDAANFFNTDIIIDVEGDKIYTDSVYVDKIAIKLQNSDVEFIIGNDVTEVFNPTNHFIHGFVPAGFKTKTLEKICNLKISKNTETGYREFFLNPKICKFEFLILNENYPKKLRLTLDYEEDLQFAKAIFSNLGTLFSKDDVLNLLKIKPELFDLTNNIHDLWNKNYEKNKADLRLNSG